MSQELHQLINALSKGEKRAIVLSADRTEGNKNFLELYYALLKQPHYDEEQLIKENEDKPFVKHLGFTKNYLQNFILKELRTIHTDYKISIKIKNYLIDVELLFWKGHFKLALKLINQAKILAENYDYPLMLEELYYWERRIVTSGSMKIPKILHYTADKRFEIMAKYFNSLEYKKLINEATAILRESDEIRDQTDLQKINKLASHSLLVDVKNALSKKAVYDFYIVNAALARIKGEKDKSLNYHSLLQQHIKLNSHIFIEENPIFFLGSCNNILVNALQFNDLKLYNDTYQAVTSKVYKEEYTNAYYNSRIFGFLLNSSIQKKQYYDVQELVKSENVSFNQLVMEEVQLLNNFYCVVINFYCKNFKEALVFINLILNSPKKHRVDIICSTMIFNILVHFELNHYDLVDNILPHHLNYLKKHRLLSFYDGLFLKSFLKLISSRGNVEQKKLLKEIKNRLLSAKNNKSFHEDIDYIGWLDEKINK